MATEQERQQLAQSPYLVLRLLEARNLKAVDFNGLSDPFVEARIKNETAFFRTKGKLKLENNFSKKTASSNNLVSSTQSLKNLLLHIGMKNL